MNLTIDQIQAMLTVDKHRLDEALVVQADIMFRISDHITDAADLSADLADQVKQIEMAAFLERKDAGDADKKADAYARTHPARVKLAEKLAAAKRDLARWSGLHEAWKARGYAIRELAQLYAAQYFVVGPNSTPRGTGAVTQRVDYTKEPTTSRRRRTMP